MDLSGGVPVVVVDEGRVVEVVSMSGQDDLRKVTQPVICMQRGEKRKEGKGKERKGKEKGKKKKRKRKKKEGKRRNRMGRITGVSQNNAP